MKWFKFYGQDFLTDPKIRRLTAEEKLCWVILMCLANAEDKKGDVSYINSEDIMNQAGIENGSPMWAKTFNFIKKFEVLKLIKIRNEFVTDSNETLHYDVTLINFDRRQQENLSNAERQKKYRFNKKIASKTLKPQRNDSNVTLRNDSNSRIDKNRIDKNIYKEINKENDSTSLVTLSPEKPLKEVNPYSKLDGLTEVDLVDISERYRIPLPFVESKYDDLRNWCEATGKKYKDYRAALINWVKKDAQKLALEQSKTLNKFSVLKL